MREEGRDTKKVGKYGGLCENGSCINVGSDQKRSPSLPSPLHEPRFSRKRKAKHETAFEPCIDAVLYLGRWLPHAKAAQMLKAFF